MQILNGLSLNVAPGKTAAIVGSSGAGKSTIISLILRFYDPNSGQVCIDDIPVSEFNVNWLRNQIGLVSQEPVLFGVSIKENISYGRENVTEYEVEEAAKQANAHDFITKLPAVNKIILIFFFRNGATSFLIFIFIDRVTTR